MVSTLKMTTDPTVLAPFSAVLASSTASASTPHPTLSKARKAQLVSKDGLKLVGKVRAGIEQGVDAQKTAISETVTSNFPSFSHTHRSSTSLLTRLSTTSATLDTLSSSLTETAQLTAPLLTLLSSRRTHAGHQANASLRTRVLGIVKERVNRLEGLHHRILDGKGAEEGLVKEVMEELEVGKPVKKIGALNKGKGKEGAVDAVEEALRGSKAWKVLNNRASHLHSLLQNLLEESFNTAVEIDASGVLKVMDSVRVLPPDHSTLPSTPVYPLSTLLAALSALHLLTPLLRKLHSRLISTYIEPLLASDLSARSSMEEGPRRLVIRTEVVAGQEGASKLWLVEAPAEDGDGPEQGDRRVFACVKRLLEGLRPLTSPETSDSGLSASLDAFKQDLQRSIAESVLEKYLVKSMPRSPERLIGWADLLRRGVDFEKSLGGGASAGPATDALGMHDQMAAGSTTIEEFYSSKAAGLWVMERRKGWFEAMRKLIVEDGWKGWDAVDVTRERKLEPVVEVVAPVVGPAPAEGPLPVAAEPSKVEENGKKGEPEAESPAEEDGWSFNDDWQTAEDATTAADPPAPATPPRPPAPEPEPVVDDDADGGWGFDEDADSKPVEPEPEPEPILLTPKKAIRVAKKIGRSKNKTEGEESPYPTPQTPQAEFPAAKAASPPPPPSPAPAVPAPAQEPEDETNDWSWGDAETAENGSGKTVPKVVQPEIPSVISETCAVSSACWDVLELTEDALRLSISFSPELLDVEPFSKLPEALHQSAREIFELYRALMPVAHKKEIEDVPSLSAQFVNDCEELARRIPDLQEQYRWTANAAEERLRLMGEIAHNRQMQSQRIGIGEILDETKGFQDVALQSDYERCLRLMEQVRDKIEVLHRVWMHVMIESTCLTDIGSLVNTAVAHVTSDILAIQDITADDSAKINKLCSELRTLEGLFTTDSGFSVVAHVPGWLKFCYISELLEASLADIRYLHETGALVDFSTDELVHLLHALFTDTPLRTQVIDRIVGHEA